MAPKLEPLRRRGTMRQRSKRERKRLTRINNRLLYGTSRKPLVDQLEIPF